MRAMKVWDNGFLANKLSLGCSKSYLRIVCIACSCLHFKNVVLIQFYIILIFLSENDEKPADLTEKIVFKSKKKRTDEKDEEKGATCANKSETSKEKRREQAKSKLSFGDDVEDEEDDEWNVLYYALR